MNVLVADDEPGVRASVAAALREARHEVTEVGDGHAVLEAVSTARPDLIFLDLRMPRMSGLEVLKWLQRHCQAKPIPVVVLSGFVATLDQFDHCPFVVEVLQKPFYLKQLLDATRAAEEALAPA